MAAGIAYQQLSGTSGTSPMHRKLIAIITALCAVFAVSTGRAEPLPTDPALVRGTLDNGLTYILKRNAHPPGRAIVWIHFHTGSLNETDPQRGLAHYLEHLAFNGTENFPPGSVVPFFQSLGMQFGRDQNAFTSFEQTTYQLSLPDAQPDTIAKGMTFFADVLWKMSLLPAEIEEERGIIQEERRRSLSGRQRTMYHVLERIAPGSLYGQRITIGTEATINSVQEQDFRDYYNKWYTASNATLMVVADADSGSIIPIIRQKFGPAPTKPRPTPQQPGIKAYDSSFAIVASDPEIRSEDINISRLEPPRPPTTTKAQFRDDLVARLAVMAFNNRLDEKVAKGGTAYLNGNASMSNNANIMWQAGLRGRAAPGKWRETIRELALEWTRAREFGFTALEIEIGSKEIIAGAERAVETDSTRPSGAIIARLNAAVTDGEAILSAQQNLDLVRTMLPTITSQEVSARFRKEFDPSALCFTAVLPSGPDVPSESQLLEVGLQAFAVTAEKEEERARATTLLSTLPSPGKVTETTLHEASGVTSAWLSNNIRVHHRFMDERKNQATVRIGLVGGDIFEDASNRGITQAAQLAFGRSKATRRLSSTDISDLMAGKKVNVGGGGMGGGGRGGRGGGGGIGGDPDTVSLSVSGSPDELETGFQLAYLLLTEPRIEPAAFSQMQTMMRTMLTEMTKNPMMMGMRLSMTAPYPDDEPRTRIPTPEQIDSLTVDKAQAWLDRMVASAPIEVAIVGDISRDRALELAAKYLGALPGRERVSSDLYKKERTIARPKGPRTVEETIDTATPQSFVMCGFYGADDRNIDDVRALSMAARLLSTRMIKEVREDAQLVYSIGASSRPGTAYPGFGFFSAGAPTDPGKAAALIDKLQSMFARFAAEGPSQDELDIAKKQMANTLDETMKDPSFWMGRLDMMTYRGNSLDDALAMPAAYQNMTADQIRAVFANYCTDASRLVVLVKPKSAATENAD